MNLEKDSFFNNVILLFRRLLGGRINFTKNNAAVILTMEDGKQFQVIRDLKVDSKIELDKSAAVFIVRFKFSGLPLGVNKRLSMFPTPFLIAKSGFREKIWSFNEDGYFQGIYQWTTREYAEIYPRTFIFKLMTKRSEKGTLSCEIISNTILSEYLESLFTQRKN